MSRAILDLSNEKWQCEHIRPGQGEIEEFHKIPCERQGSAFNWNCVKISGDVYTDLQRVKEIDNPFFGQNMYKMKWVQEQEYWYMCKFNIPEDVKNKKKLDLIFEGVDYSCKVWINGHELGSHEGMFSSFKFDVTNYVNHEHWLGGSNIILLRLDPPPRNFEKVSGMKFNYNGDYHTGLVPFGIWRPIKLIGHSEKVVEDLRIESKVTDSKDTKVEFDFIVNSLVVKSEEKRVELSIKGQNCDTKEIKVLKNTLICSGKNKVKFDLEIKNANLWWPWDMGKQNLHMVEIKVLDLDGNLIDIYHERFGIREVTMTMNPGYRELEVENPWTFMINGKTSYLRAACWGGQPSLLYGKNSDKKYNYLLNLVR